MEKELSFFFINVKVEGTHNFLKSLTVDICVPVPVIFDAVVSAVVVNIF